MSFVILSKSPSDTLLSREHIRLGMRKLLHINRGPDAVFKSLFRGLDEVGQPYKLNPKGKNISAADTVLVNGSISALRWAIEAKKSGTIKTLIAGPNLVITPNDFGGVINSPEIDLILQPSDWVRDFYITINAELSSKINIWPSGVAVPPMSEQEKNTIVVYVKNDYTKEQLRIIEDALSDQTTRYLLYGKFNQQDFFDALASAKGMIYLSNSESQGIALQEAWVRDVPTLVWDRGYFEHETYRFEAANIASPYIDPRCGMTFTSFEAFPNALATFLHELETYNAREYVVDTLSDKKSVERLLALIPSV